MAADSTLNDVGSGIASTNEPRPWNVSIRPSARSLVTASRTTVRETRYSSMSSASDGSLWPGGSSPARILCFRPATNPCASVVVIVATSSPAELGALLGERPHLLAEREAEPGPVGNPDPAVADLDALVEQRVEPLEVFDPRLGGVRRREVQVDLHRVVRRQGQACMRRQRRELQEGRDPADAWRV